jgi:hypothetical protein
VRGPAGRAPGWTGDAVAAGQWHFCRMSENTQNPSEEPYDPDKDADTDPDMLNPRAEGAEDADVEGDPDADPGMLNPRETE